MVYDEGKNTKMQKSYIKLYKIQNKNKEKIAQINLNMEKKTLK